jgi:mono/diheme cytochrome c family protein
VLAAQARETRPGPTADVLDLDEDGQRRQLPPLPQGMTLQMIREGDALYRGKGGCVTCHGPEGGGMPAAGSGITAGLNFVPSEWGPLDSLIRAGVPEPVSRTPMAMPPRGAQSNLTEDESRRIAAYTWAISQVRGEPWEGGHKKH